MRTIIDISQLAGWQGKLTGIPRVMYELSTRFADFSHEVIFIGWDAGRGMFWELPFDEIQKKRQQVNSLDSLEVNEQSKLEMRQVLRGLYDRSPSLVKTVARRLKGRRSAYHATEPLNGGFEFKQNDKLLILWGEWGDEKYRHTIIQAVSYKKVDLYQLVYDMLPLVTPQYSSHSTDSLMHYAEEIYPLCHKLISISQHTSKDVKQWLESRHLPVPMIETIRLGENFEALAPHKPKHSFFSQYHPYIICVGTIETRKNHTLLYYVYKLAKSRNIKLPPLVIVGRRGWLTENIYDLITTDPDTKDSFVFLHNASDEELAWLYGHSLFSIYPSHYEGWGLPIAESIAYGTPCISSNTSSMPEIAGDLILYFSPSSTDECLNAICYLLDEKHREEALNKIKLYEPTDWNETFRQTQKIIGEGSE